MTTTAGIVLAAGGSRRAGCAKALATIEGETLIARAVRVLAEAGCDPIVVVVGAPHGNDVARAVEHRARIVTNDAPERGMLSSLQCALATTRADRIVVTHVDRPRVTVATIRALIAETHGDVVQPRHRGALGHPYVVGAALADALCRAPLDRTAADVLRGARDRRAIDVDDPGVLDDLDTPRDLARVGALAPA